MKKMVVILCIVVLGIAFLVIPVAAQTEVCHEDALIETYGCSACTPAPHLQVTRTCDGIDLTWNDIGADRYLLAIYMPAGEWVAVGFFDPQDTSYSMSNNILPGLHSFAIIPFEKSQAQCYSNIVCDVEFPTTCTNTPEFPTMLLPFTMIIGFLGAVLLIQRTREQ